MARTKVTPMGVGLQGQDLGSSSDAEVQMEAQIPAQGQTEAPPTKAKIERRREEARRLEEVG